MTDTALPFDSGELDAWLRKAGILAGPVAVRPIGEGHSNLTYAVSDGSRSVVVRRPPPPPIPPGANDVLREARILTALGGSGVPVPQVLGVAPESDVMDVPFYVMEHLEGEVVTARLPAALDAPGERRRIGEALIDVLAALHAVDWEACGLADLARPAGFLERQLDRLPRIIADAEGRIPHRFGDLRDELRETLPASGPAAILHGDLRLGNVMLSRTAPARILGVLDWELAGIGDPLVDVGYTLATYAVPGEALHALTELSAATLSAGFPSRDQLAERYAAGTGRDLSRLAWYEALALWKLAVLFEFSRRRFVCGGGDPYYATPGLVDGLLEAARRGFLESVQPMGRLPATWTPKEA